MVRSEFKKSLYDDMFKDVLNSISSSMLTSLVKNWSLFGIRILWNNFKNSIGSMTSIDFFYL